MNCEGISRRDFVRVGSLGLFGLTLPALLRGQAAAEGQSEMRLIFVRGLTEKTHGNASGIGLADFTTTRLVRAMSYRDTVINCLTAGYPEGAFVPVHFETDREVLDAALAIVGTRRPEEARVMRIRNTLCVEELEISEACLAVMSMTSSCSEATSQERK